MKERILLFIIIVGLTTFIYVFQNYTAWGLGILVCLMGAYFVQTLFLYLIFNQMQVDRSTIVAPIVQVRKMHREVKCLRTDAQQVGDGPGL
jgi:hypothetical protein